MKEKKMNFKRVGRIVLLSLISILVGIRLYSWNAETIAGNAMPMPFGFGVTVVLSGSMEPELSVDDLVIVTRQDDYQIGDVVVYQDGRSLVIHRIQDIDGETVVTKGDANNTEDDPISSKYIKGKAVFHIPFVGLIARFMKTPAAFILILIAAAALFEIPYLRERKKAEDEKEKIKEEIRKLKDKK